VVERPGVRVDARSEEQGPDNWSLASPAAEHRPRLHLQVPAMDGDSAWYANQSGDDSPPGIVTLWLEPDNAFRCRVFAFIAPEPRAPAPEFCG
jgi:hypothetical protein